MNFLADAQACEANRSHASMSISSTGVLRIGAQYFVRVIVQPTCV